MSHCKYEKSHSQNLMRRFWVSVKFCLEIHDFFYLYYESENPIEMCKGESGSST